MVYSLKGDRHIEWGWVDRRLPRGKGTVLEIGPAPKKPKPSYFAVERGWQVTGVGLEEPKWKHERFDFVQGDFNTVKLVMRFDWILNISTIEHFGLVGRYGITENDPNADIKGMRKARRKLKKGGQMLLTIPVGQDAVMSWRHRVYGWMRLPELLAGYRVEEAEYYAKTGTKDTFDQVEKSVALAVKPTLDPSYYGIGLFVLGV